MALELKTPREGQEPVHPRASLLSTHTFSVLCSLPNTRARRMYLHCACTPAHRHRHAGLCAHVRVRRLYPTQPADCTGNTGTGHSPARIPTQQHTVTHTLPGTHLVTQIFAQNFRLKETWSWSQVRQGSCSDRVADPGTTPEVSGVGQAARLLLPGEGCAL